MASYAHAHKAQGARLNLSFLAGGLRFPWVSLTFLFGFIIQAMLATRLWLQLNNTDLSGMRHALITVTDVLVSPFQNGDSTGLQDRANGVFEYSTLIAVEVYLLAMLAIIAVIVALRFAVFGVRTGVALKRWHSRRATSRAAAAAQTQESTTSRPPSDAAAQLKPLLLPQRLAGTHIAVSAGSDEHEVTHR